MGDVRLLGARTTPVPPPPDRQMWDSGMGPRMVWAVAPRSMFPLAPTLEEAMSAPCASLFPPVKGVEETGDPVSLLLHPRARLWVGGCDPKASSASKQSVTSHEARLMFAAGSSPRSGGTRRGGEGGFNDLPDPTHYQC